MCNFAGKHPVDYGKAGGKPWVSMIAELTLLKVDGQSLTFLLQLCLGLIQHPLRQIKPS